jgi:DNA-binding transcriptional ArsR family regulator
MAGPESRTGPERRKADVNRRRREIVRCLEDFPRQYAALEHAMAAFGADFDLREFKAAYESSTDMDAYNRVQALERALGRVQNYVSDLAIAGVRLAQIAPRTEVRGSAARQAFVALRDAKVIDAELCRRLVRAQEARTTIEHSYLNTPAGHVHRSARLVHDAARDFIGRYRTWIEPMLERA